MTGPDPQETDQEFNRVMNMAPGELEGWLQTDDSRSVGWTREGEDESAGHHSGRRIVEINRKRKADLTDDDDAHMRKVIGYVHRHWKQVPGGDVSDTRWRYSLMNRGHDPRKEPGEH